MSRFKYGFYQMDVAAGINTRQFGIVDHFIEQPEQPTLFVIIN